MTRTLYVLLPAALALSSCARRPTAADEARIEGSALHELFVAREHARLLVAWTDAAERGPTFDLVGQDDAPLDSSAVAMAVGIPITRVRSADLASLFRAHPDGWAAFYAAFPGAPGLVEVARPVWSGDGAATVVVGRACGEHCFQVWRVTVRDGHVVATAPIHVPKS